jgi:hypothetical protein
MKPITTSFIILDLDRWKSRTSIEITLNGQKKSTQIQEALGSGENLFDLVKDIPFDSFIDPYYDFQGASPDFYDIYSLSFKESKHLKLDGEKYRGPTNSVGLPYVSREKVDLFRKNFNYDRKIIIIEPKQLLSEQIQKIRAAISKR